jgi:hypothetical protein
MNTTENTNCAGVGMPRALMVEPINYCAATSDTGTSRLVYHVIDYRTGFASCGTRVLLGLSMPAADVPKNLRCRKSLCDRRFFVADETRATSS